MKMKMLGNWIPAPEPWLRESQSHFSPRRGCLPAKQADLLTWHSRASHGATPSQCIVSARKKPVLREKEDRESFQKYLSTNVGLPVPPLPNPWRGRSSLKIPQDLGHPPVPSPGLVTLTLALDDKTFTNWSLVVFTRMPCQSTRPCIPLSGFMAFLQPLVPASPTSSHSVQCIPRHTVTNSHGPSNNGIESFTLCIKW